MYRHFRFLYALVLLFGIGLAYEGETRVVINEIMYHPPNDLEALEYIELHNFGDAPVDLSGWQFTNGIRYTFPDGSQIAPGGYIVVCRDLELFRGTYGEDIAALGNFEGSLNNGEERVTLSDANGEQVDTVKYSDQPPWPVSADGYSASLERITPSEASEVFNWAGSPLPPDERQPVGAPGRQNANYSANLPPVISFVTFSPDRPAPNQSIRVQAKVEAEDGAEKVVLLYRVAGSGSLGEEQALAMNLVSDDAIGRYEAAIPGQPDRSLVRFRVQATDRSGAVRFYPAQNDLRPTLSCFVYENTETATVPLAFIIHVERDAYEEALWMREQNRREMRGGRQFWQAESMLRQGMNLEAVWFHLVIEQDLSDEQIRRVRPVYREHFETRERQIEAALQAEDLEEAMGGFPGKIQAFNAALLDKTRSALTEAQYQQLTQWHEQYMRSATMGGFRWGAERVIKWLINLERAFFYQTITLDLNEVQQAQLKEVYHNALGERQKLIEAARPFEDDEEKRDQFFEQAAAQNKLLPDESKPVLTAEQYKEFSQWYDKELLFRFGFEPPRPSPPPRGSTAFIYISPDGRRLWTYDYVTVAPRSGGYKVRFHKDQPLQFASAELTTINLLYEYTPRFVLAEHLAYAVYRRAGVPAPLSGHIRLKIDEDWVGYHLLVEQPNRAFLRRNERDDDGNLYKILWYEQGVIDQHEKKTNIHTGHDDIVNLIESLNQTEGDAQWEVIQRHFNVEEVINYFAVNMCISNWDGFFNNYFTYHDTDGGGKWEMYPWDEDKTWGFYDEIPPGEVFHDMPLTFGMNGDVPPGLDSLPEGGAMAWMRPGVPNWWRGPGYFSGPLLANPHFRQRFLARLKELAEAVYTEAVCFPIIDEMAERLTPEVRIRAEANGENVDKALETFHNDIQSLRQHVTLRRNFILAQEEIQRMGR